MNAAENAGRHREKQQSELVPVEVPRVLSQDHAAYAVNFFFEFYICLPKDPDVQRGIMDCLYPVWMRTGSTSPLRPIVTAVASVMLDAWSQVKPNQPLSLSRSQYTQGVAALRKSLQDTDGASDEIIMAALMLDMYENLLSFLTAQRTKNPHMNGTTALIESRRKKPATDEISQRLILGTRTQLLGRAVSNVESVPSVVSTWSEVTSALPTTPTFRLDEFNIKLANLQALASRLTNDSEILKDHVDRILKQANELDQQFSSWTENLPTDWIPTKVSGPECIPQSVRDTGLYQDSCDIYKSIFVANTFNSYYSSRIKLQLTIITCLERLDSNSSRRSMAAVLLVIQDLADTICASIPFHLGDRIATGRIDDRSVRFPSVGERTYPEGHHAASGAFGGFFLCAQLFGLLSPGVPLRSGQKQWIGGQIGRIKRICNIGTT